MRIAVIDLGTNTFNLVVAEFKSNYYTILYQDKFPVKLGEGGINQSIIQPEPFWRGIDNIEKILSIIKSFEVTKTHAIATSAIRESSNGAQFVDVVYKLFRLKINVVSGNKEAELIYSGVKSALDLQAENSLIMDIGGGSTEFIIANNKELLWKKSFKLGAARLLEKFNPSEPILIEEKVQLENYLAKELKPLFKAIAKFKVCELIGSSGSFDTLAELICGKFNLPNGLAGKTSFDFNINDMLEIHADLLASNRLQRMNMPGMLSMRVDMIVIASIFTHYIMRENAIKRARLSTYSLKEGLLYNMIQQKK